MSHLFLQPNSDHYEKGTYLDDEGTEVEWQSDDLEMLFNRSVCANWSMMGCYKTTTLLWDIEQKMSTLRVPKVLIVTTRSGKGTYYKHVPHLLPGWNLVSLTTQKAFIVINGKEVEIDLKELRGTKFPTLVVINYQVMTRRKLRAKTDEEREAFARAKYPPKAMSRMGQLVQDTKWDYIALDEAHRIKNPKTSWSAEIYKLDAVYRQVMTGTGFINRPDELYGLLHFLDKKKYSSYWSFREDWCDEIIVGGFRKILGVKPELKDDFRKLVRSYGPRRTVQEVFKNLKDPIHTEIPVDLNPTQKRMYDDIVNDLYTLDKNGEPLHSPNVLSQLNRLRQISVATPEITQDYFDERQQRRIVKVRLTEPSSKLDALMEIIDGLEWDEERKDQIVVFSCFRDPIQLAIARFEQAGISYLHMKDTDSDQERLRKWAVQFPKKEEQVFICTLQLGSESISLTSATTCVFLDQSWSPKDNEQGVSRVWRPPQEYAAHIIRLHARGTVDNRIFATNQQKLRWFHEIFGPEDTPELEREAVQDALKIALG
jgi:SNF2 family DNA or RNA helicase